VLKELDDERGAQVLRDYDAVFEELKKAMTRFQLDPPPLFQNPINHTVYTFFNSREEEAAEVEDPQEIENSKVEAAAEFINHLVATNNLSLLVKKKFRELEGNF
jgi:hypothetical protein